MDILASILGIIRLIIGLVLVLFLPGFAISWVFFPDENDIPWLTRVAVSTVLSIASVILAVICMDMILGIDSTPFNIVIIILILTVVAFAVWRIEQYISMQRMRAKISATRHPWIVALKNFFRRIVTIIFHFFRTDEVKN